MKAILDSQRDRRVPGRVAGLCVAAAVVAMILPVAALRAQSAEELPADIDAMMRAAVMQKNAAALENMAMRAADLAKYDVSMKLMKSALEVRTQTSGAQSKEYAQSLMKMGRLQWRKGDDASRQTFVKAEEMLKDLPESAEALIHLAFAEISVKNYEQAERMLDKAASLDAKSAARAKMWIGVIREKQGKPEDADFLYRSAHSLAEADSEEAATILEVHSQMLKGLPGKAEEAGLMNGKALEYRKARGMEQVAKRPLSEGVRKIGGEVRAPSVLSKVEPAYSQEARLARYQGAVVASLEIGTDGTPQNVRIVRGLGLGLSEKAIDAIQQWKFKPGTVNGEPVPVMATIEVNFRLL